MIFPERAFGCPLGGFSIHLDFAALCFTITCPTLRSETISLNPLSFKYGSQCHVVAPHNPILFFFRLIEHYGVQPFQAIRSRGNHVSDSNVRDYPARQ